MYVNKKKEKKNTRKWMWQARSLRPGTGTGHIYQGPCAISFHLIGINHTGEHGFINKLLKRLWTRETTSKILLNANRSY